MSGCCGVDTIGGKPASSSGVIPDVEFFVAGEAIGRRDLVALNISGEVILADAVTANDDFQVVGVATATVLAGALVPVVVVHGTSTEMLFSPAPAAASNGSYVFLDTFPGRATVVPPAPGVNVRIIVGILRTANGVAPNPNVQFQTHVL